MQVHWSYFDCDKEDEEQLQRQWEDRQRRLFSRLEAHADEPAELELVADRQDESPQWQIQSALHLPDRTVVVRAAGNEPGEAVENIVTGLIDEIDQLPERPEKITLRREGLQSVVPILEQCRRNGRSDVFCTWLAPVVATLDKHVRHELRTREAESDGAITQVTSNDVLDEVLVRAYDQFDRRPQNLSLDLWLVQLAQEVLDESCRTLAEQSLDEQVPKPTTEPREAWRDRWTEWSTVSETMEMGDMLPTVPGIEAWDALDLETKKTETDRMLSRLPRDERQALVLNTVYGFPVAEVADFQGRSQDDVRAAIQGGRYSLERYFLEQYLPRLEERIKTSSSRPSRQANQ
ncbi:MAG: RNA polymerase sigma factor [Planctomycetota bacterium]